MKKNIVLFFLIFPLLSFPQKLSNIHFEQVDKQIHIYYNLEGDQVYMVKAFYSKDNGYTWKGPLNNVIGEVGIEQLAGKNKAFIWDVLDEIDELSGYIQFRITAEEEFYRNSGKFVDSRDSMIYKWVKIGDQIWMSENLNYAGVRNYCYGSNLAPGRYLPNIDMLGCANIGRFYSWDDAINSCPEGWRLPTDDEWKILEVFLGMKQSEVDRKGSRGMIEGRKLKSVNSWPNNLNGTNEVGFNAMLSGLLVGIGDDFMKYDFIKGTAFFWSSTESIDKTAWVRELNEKDDKIYRLNFSKNFGLNIRCIKD